jgi:hypothetical protein
MVTIIVAVLIIASCSLSILVIAASVLSSRFQPSHPMIEEYEARDDQPAQTEFYTIYLPGEL